MSSPSSSALLPLGALAAGLGLLALPSFAQTDATAAPSATAAPPSPAVATSLAAGPTVTLPEVHVQGATATGKDSLRATTSTIGKGKQALRDIPQSVTVVTERLIDDRNLDTVKDVLRNTAGISFMAAEGGEEDIRLRGFSLQATGDIFVDGIRDPAFYERDTFNDDRLEVLRGSASMLFGRGSTGGAVNQVSKPTLPIDRNEVAMTLGSGRYVRATGDFNIVTGEDAGLRINAMTTNADNDGAGLRKVGIASQFRWGIGTVDEFSVGLTHLVNRNGINYGLPWLPTGPGAADRTLLPVATTATYGMASDYSDGSASYGTLGHVHRFGPTSELKTTLRLGRYERDQRASAVRFAAAALQPDGLAATDATLSDATVLTRGTNNKVQDLGTTYLQSDYSGRFQAFGLAHSILAGVDLAHERFTGYATVTPAGVTLSKPTTTVGTPDDGAFIDEALRLREVNRTFDAKSVGVYAQDLLQIAPAWKILGGLRWDRFEGRYATPVLTAANGTVTPATERARTDAVWSKRVGLLYQPSETQSYHFSYGTSFNTSGDTYQYDALGSNTPPEASRNIELGARIDSADGRVTTRLALFRATKFNERNRDELSVGPTNYVLSGQRHAAGFEVDIAGRITPEWEVYASYAFIPDAKVDVASSVLGTTLIGETVGQRPGLTPRHSGNVWTTYRIDPAWRIGGGVTARSSDSPQQSTIVAPRFVTADLMAEYENGPWTLKLNLTNVADALYADVLYRGHYIAGKPRTLQLTTVYRF
jgi:catecholate siderophore receptor